MFHHAIMKLSPKELEILRCIIDEMTTKAIAEKFFLSEHTISNYRKDLKKKTKTNSVIGLVKWGIRNGLPF